MIKLWIGKCPTDCFCIEDSDIGDCAKKNDGTVTAGVFLTDAEYEAMKNCKEILTEGHINGYLHLGNAGDAIRRYEKAEKEAK